MVGEVPQGSGLTVNLPTGYALVGTYVPVALALAATNGFPMVDNTLYLSYDNTVNNYVTDIIFSGAWYHYTTTQPATVIPAVGQGYFINNPVAATTWQINFTVQ